MKLVILSAVMISASVLVANSQNANVAWENPAMISGSSDVNIEGMLYGTWAPGDDWGGTNRSDYYPVNGVTFAAYGTSGVDFNISGSGINMDRYNGFANPNTPDSNYNYLLQTAEFNWNASSSSMILSWSNMTVGNTYLVQMWLNDGRSGQTGTSTFKGGVNTSDPVAIGDGTPGQYIIGTFVADATGSESITISPGIMLNLVQVRDLTSVPEPSVAAMLTVGIGIMLIGLRRRNYAAQGRH